MKKIIAILLLSTLGTALADTDPQSPLPLYHSGFYLGANIGYTNGNSSSTGTVTDFMGNTINFNYSTEQAGVSGGFDIGYLFIRYLGMELEYSLYPTLKSTGENILYPAENNPTSTLQEDSSTLDVMLKAVLPFSQTGFSLFVKLGPAFFFYPHQTLDGISAGSVPVGFGLAAAGGAEYKFTPNWSISATVKSETDFTTAVGEGFVDALSATNLPNSGISPVSYSLGVSYQF